MPENETPIDPFLQLCVRVAVGDKAEARAGQLSLARSIFHAFDTRSHCLSKAPTGTGKSLAALSVAIWFAVNRGERTIISTHALTLQDQYVATDAPPAVRAAEQMFGRAPSVAVLKGNSNYVSISKLSGFLHAVGLPITLVSEGTFAMAIRELQSVSDGELSRGADTVSYLWKKADKHPPLSDVRAIVTWALNVHLDEDEHGDKQSCEFGADPVLWSLVSGGSGSVSSKKAKGDIPVRSKQELAKERASFAQVVLTNHALVGIRAATGRQVVIDSAALGPFDHVVIDEAHVLPGNVRSQGESACSSKLIARVQSSGRELTRAKAMTEWTQQGESLRVQMDRTLEPWVGRKVQPDDDPLGPVRDAVEGWMSKAAIVVKATRAQATSPLARERFLEAVADLTAALKGTTEHRVGNEVRWVDRTNRDHGPAQISVAPIAVGGLLWNNVWHRPPIEDRPQDEQHLLINPDKDRDPEVPLGVVGMSATLPPSARIDLGVRAEIVEHPSPFDANYAASVAFLPIVGFDVWASMLEGKKFLLDVHAEFARQHAERTVRANGGRALLLSATTKGGKAIAAHLRAANLGVQVYSQWDAIGLDAVKAKWKKDETSVLVGSDSLMTGVDAPGETCSYVWVDRVPRKPKNEIDDGRVDALIAQGWNAFNARETIYAGDAAAKLEQIIGRLIRSSGDRGMFSCADIRLVPNQPGSYGELARSMYVKPLAKFGLKVTDFETAEAWLADRQRERLGVAA